MLSIGTSNVKELHVAMCVSSKQRYACVREAERLELDNISLISIQAYTQQQVSIVIVTFRIFYCFIVLTVICLHVSLINYD